MRPHQRLRHWASLARALLSKSYVFEHEALLGCRSVLGWKLATMVAIRSGHERRLDAGWGMHGVALIAVRTPRDE